MRSKYFVYTLNNYTDDELEQLRSLGTNENVVYHVHGREVGENGTPHLQGYIEFSRRLRLNQVKDLCGDRAHFESRRGTPQQARDYCVKDGDYWEKGSLSTVSQGSRTDLQAACDDILAGKRIRDIAESNPTTFVKYTRGLLALRRTTQAGRDWKPDVQVYWGDPGTGKTRRVYDSEESEVYSHPGGQWFDGYDGQEAVLFDDFTGSCFKIQYLLKLIDRYPMDVPIKGGFVAWIPRRIFFTSNIPFEQWYPGARDVHVRALRRRIDNITHFTNLMN